VGLKSSTGHCGEDKNLQSCQELNTDSLVAELEKGKNKKRTGSKEPRKNDNNTPEFHLCHTVLQQGSGCLHVHLASVLCKNPLGT
jgi:hypothetical protein